MAVRIDGGENRILFEYEYLPIKAGAVCSIAGVLHLRFILSLPADWKKIREINVVIQEK